MQYSLVVPGYSLDSRDRAKALQVPITLYHTCIINQYLLGCESAKYGQKQAKYIYYCRTCVARFGDDGRAFEVGSLKDGAKNWHCDSCQHEWGKKNNF